MTTLSLSISTSNDDGQFGAAGYGAAAAIQVGQYFGDANGWFRFPNVTIANGASVSSCLFKATGTGSASGTASLIFKFVKEANPTYPTSTSDANSRSLTTASGTASYSGTYTTTDSFVSPNISSAATEVFAQGGWASGNASMLFVKDNGSGGFENRVQLRSQDYGSNVPNITWIYSVALSAAVVVGTVALTGVAATAKKRPAVTVGTVALTGVAATTRKRPAVAVGSITAAGVAPSTRKRAGVSVGTVTLAGVSPASRKTVQLFATATMITDGVTPLPRRSAAVPAGSLAFAHGPRNDIQRFYFNGATSGNVQVSTTTPGFAVPTALFAIESQASWEAAFGNGFLSTVTATGDGFTVLFDKASTASQEVALYSIDFDGSGLVTIAKTQSGRGYPISVRKEAAVTPGTVTCAGVLPFIGINAQPEAGSVTLAGVTPESRHLAAIETGGITTTGVSPELQDRGLVAVGQIELAGVRPVVRHLASAPIGLITFGGTTIGAGTTHAVGVGSITFAGLAAEVSLVTYSGPFFAVAWLNWQPGSVAGENRQPGGVEGENWQPGARAGTNL